MSDKYVVFDLDDTLVLEIDFLKSAFKKIALKLGDGKLYKTMLDKYFRNENVFEYLTINYKVGFDEIMTLYRGHFPDITLIEGANVVLEFCKKNEYKIGLLTDGRSLTQRNKLKALNIEHLFDRIVVSEEFGSKKPEERNYLVFMEDKGLDYYYIGDNYTKDFVTPNRLNWTTVALKDAGQNIHSQNLEVDFEYKPHYAVAYLTDILNIIK